MELEHVLVYGLVNVGGEEFIPNQAEIKVIFHGGMSWLYRSLKVEFIWGQFLKGVSQKISRFGTVSSFQYLLGLVVVSKNTGMWILRDHTWDNYRDRGLWEISHKHISEKNLKFVWDFGFPNPSKLQIMRRFLRFKKMKSFLH